MVARVARLAEVFGTNGSHSIMQMVKPFRGSDRGRCNVGYRIFVPETQHALSEVAGMTLFMQHLAFGFVVAAAGLTYVQAAHLASVLQAASQSSM